VRAEARQDALRAYLGRVFGLQTLGVLDNVERYVVAIAALVVREAHVSVAHIEGREARGLEDGARRGLVGFYGALERLPHLRGAVSGKFAERHRK
jgi:hypothetical protein